MHWQYQEGWREQATCRDESSADPPSAVAKSDLWLQPFYRYVSIARLR